MCVSTLLSWIVDVDADLLSLFHPYTASKESPPSLPLSLHFSMTNGKPSAKTTWLYNELKRAEVSGDDARTTAVIRMIHIHDARVRATDGAARGSDLFFLHVAAADVVAGKFSNPRRVCVVKRASITADLVEKFEDAPFAYDKKRGGKKGKKQRVHSHSSSCWASLDCDSSEEEDDRLSWRVRKARSFRYHGRK